MKRLLTMILTLAMLASLAVPFAAFATETGATAPAYPDLTESEYNSLYVTDGLVFMIDFFRTNSYWREEGVTYAAPVGPSENSAYWYDADKDGTMDDGETVDLTKTANRGTWRVLIQRGSNYTYFDPTVAPVYNGTSTPRLEYATEAEARAAANVAQETINTAIDAYNADPANENRQLKKSDYQCVVGYYASNALLDANSKWIKADSNFLASFVSVNTQGCDAASYHPALNLGRTDFASNSALLFSAFTVEDGYIQMRTDYHTSGGLLLGGSQKGYENTSSLQVVTLLGNSVTSPFVLYIGSRLTTTKNEKLGTVTPTGFTSNSTFLLPEGATFPQAGGIGYKTVQDLTYTVDGQKSENGSAFPATFSLRTLTDTSFSVAGNYTLSATTYFGWSQTAKSARVYAMRSYHSTLSSADLLQNHLADLCKFFRLDMTPLMSGEVGERTLNVAPAVLATVAGRMSIYTLADDRETVAAALAAVIDDVTLTGEGEAFDAFLAAVNAGTVDAKSVYALPKTYHERIYTAYKAFTDANPTADAAALQAAVNAAVNAVLSDPALPYAEYYGKPIAVTPAAFFAENAPSTPEATHFAALATAVGLDMAPIAAISPAIRDYVYAEFADYAPSVFYHAAILQAAITESAARIAEHYFGEGMVGEIVAFEGFQFRLVGATAYRAVYSVDTAAIAQLEEHGFTVTLSISHKVKNTAGDPTTNVVYKTGMTDEPDFMTVNGKTCMTFEYYTNEKIKVGQFVAYVLLERDGNEPLSFSLEAKSKNFPEGAKLKTMAELLAESGVVSTNVQSFLEFRKVIYPTIFIDGQNLSDFRVVSDGADAALGTMYLDVLEEATRVRFATVTAEEAAGMTSGLVLFEKGDFPMIGLRDGNVVFTYTDDLAATRAAFAAALAAPAEGYETFAFEDEDPMPVCLLSYYHPLITEEE